MDARKKRVRQRGISKYQLFLPEERLTGDTTMRVIERTVYRFDELCDVAKERAREWYRSGNLDYDWWECSYDCFEQVGNALGFDFNHKSKNTPSIWFSGFYCQGAGSSFEASYAYSKGWRKKLADVCSDPELFEIGEALQKAQAAYFYRLAAEVKPRRDTNIVVTVDCDDVNYRKIDEEPLEQAIHDFNHWIFKSLEKEYEYLQSDEVVDDSIVANEYEFDEDGNCV